jgi:hypothetical protein
LQVRSWGAIGCGAARRTTILADHRVARRDRDNFNHVQKVANVGETLVYANLFW